MPNSALARAVFISGASRGLGLELVRQLAKASPPSEILIAACRNPADASDLQSIAKLHNSVKVVKMDVEKDGDIDHAVKETASLVGDRGLNLLINNAGILINRADGGSIYQQNRERLQRTFNVNATSPIIMTQKFLPLLKLAASQDKESQVSCGRAASVTMSSFNGSQNSTYNKMDPERLMDYKCSKTAANMAAILMAQDLAKAGVLVFALHPGSVKTDMGTANSPLTTSESVSSMLQVMASAGPSDAGLLVNYKGEVIPF